MKIAPIIQEAELGQLKIIISEISVIECSHLQNPPSGMSLADQHATIDKWFESPFFARRAIHPGITREAVKLARQHNLSAADSIVLATALKDGVRVLHTGDGSGRNKGRKLLPLSGQLGSPPLTIREPDPGQLALFT